MWTQIYKRFEKLAEKTGREKNSSYIMNIIFSPDNGVSVELGTYDIPDWPRHLFLGPFGNEEEAMKSVLEKIQEAEIIVNRG